MPEKRRFAAFGPPPPDTRHAGRLGQPLMEVRAAHTKVKLASGAKAELRCSRRPRPRLVS